MSKIDPKKLASLSKEEKLKLYDTIQKKKQLAKASRGKFAPNAGQLPVLHSQKYIRLVTAGNGFGKTALGCNEALYAVEGYHPFWEKYTKTPSVGVVVLDNPLKVKEVWLKELDKWTNMQEAELIKNGKPYICEILFKNGSRILFMFHDQEELIFESLEVDWIIYDEPPPRHIFIALSRGQRTKGSRPWQLIIGTPLAAAWLRQEIFEPWERGERDDIECFRGTTDQNKGNLANNYIDQFSRLLTEEEKKIRLEGQWFDLGGLALKHLLDPKIHYVDALNWASDDPVVIAIDPHPTKKHVAVAIGKTKRDGQKYIISELSSKAVARDFAAQLHEWSRGWKVIDWVIDSLGQAEGTGNEGFMSFIQVLRECGIRCRATTYEEKLDAEWIDRIRNSLAIPDSPDNFGQRNPKLKVFRTCYNTIRDLENVSWLKVKNHDVYKEKLDIANKDFLACVKYALASNALEGSASGGNSKPIPIGGSQYSGRVGIRNRLRGSR